MSLFNLFKPKTNLVIGIKAPESFETTTLSLDVQLTLSSPVQVKIDKLSVRLRGEISNRKKYPGASPTQYLGEATYAEKELALAPNKPETLGLKLPLDFSAVDSFEIPPENLAVASEEMKAAAAANRTTNYNYSVEAVVKLADSGAEVVQRRPIRLIQQDQVRIG